MIKVYWKPNCEYCNRIKAYLDKENIQYESINLAQKENRSDMRIPLDGIKGIRKTKDPSRMKLIIFRVKVCFRKKILCKKNKIPNPTNVPRLT